VAFGLRNRNRWLVPKHLTEAVDPWAGVAADVPTRNPIHPGARAQDEPTLTDLALPDDEDRGLRMGKYGVIPKQQPRGRGLFAGIKRRNIAIASVAGVVVGAAASVVLFLDNFRPHAHQQQGDTRANSAMGGVTKAGMGKAEPTAAPTKSTPAATQSPTTTALAPTATTPVPTNSAKAVATANPTPKATPTKKKEQPAVDLSNIALPNRVIPLENPSKSVKSGQYLGVGFNKAEHPALFVFNAKTNTWRLATEDDGAYRHLKNKDGNLESGQLSLSNPSDWAVEDHTNANWFVVTHADGSETTFTPSFMHRDGEGLWLYGGRQVGSGWQHSGELGFGRGSSFGKDAQHVTGQDVTFRSELSAKADGFVLAGDTQSLR
jgi:hypothetical protein